MAGLNLQGELILAAGRFNPSEEMQVMTSSIGVGVGGIGYLTIHGKNTDAYALFGCKKWEHLTGQQQTFILEKELTVLSLQLPLISQEENDD